MAKPAPAPPQNDGGIVVALVLLMAALCTVMFGALSVYVSADNVLTPEQKTKSNYARRLARLLSGWANVGNAVTHAYLIIMLMTDQDKYKPFFPDEVESPVGPAALMIINGLVGRSTLKGGGLILSMCWNCFVAVAGSLLPVVWPKFIDVGMAQWPYLAIFLWLAIYAFESTAFFFSCVAFALKDVIAKPK